MTHISFSVDGFQAETWMEQRSWKPDRACFEPGQKVIYQQDNDPKNGAETARTYTTQLIQNPEPYGNSWLLSYYANTNLDCRATETWSTDRFVSPWWFKAWMKKGMVMLSSGLFFSFSAKNCPNSTIIPSSCISSSIFACFPVVVVFLLLGVRLCVTTHSFWLLEHEIFFMCGVPNWWKIY